MTPSEIEKLIPWRDRMADLQESSYTVDSSQFPSCFMDSLIEVICMAEAIMGEAAEAQDERLDRPLTADEIITVIAQSGVLGALASSEEALTKLKEMTK